MHWSSRVSLGLLLMLSTSVKKLSKSLGHKSNPHVTGNVSESPSQACLNFSLTQNVGQKKLGEFCMPWLQISKSNNTPILNSCSGQTCSVLVFFSCNSLCRCIFCLSEGVKEQFFFIQTLLFICGWADLAGSKKSLCSLLTVHCVSM